MNNRTKNLQVTLFVLLSLTFLHFDANAQTFLPFGPQTNVPVATVTNGGWIECYRDLYENVLNANQVLAQCPGDRLMLSCRETGSSTLTLLAQGERSDVTFDTGSDNTDVLHIANGVGWYFNNTFGFNIDSGAAWGFVRAGDSVDKNNCDVDDSGANDERLCWHLNNNGGYRCGVTEFLNESTEYERIVYTNSVTRPIPTLSEWGLIAMAGLLGLAGFIAIRRRYSTA